MIARTRSLGRQLPLALAALAMALTGTPAAAQTAPQYQAPQYPAAPYSPPQAPREPIDGDLNQAPQGGTDAPTDPTARPGYANYGANANYAGNANSAGNAGAYGQDAPRQAPPEGQTYHQDDLIGAAEGVFGKGAHGLADIIHDILRKQGEPVGYITGREAGGAFAVGLRYGSGTMYLKAGAQRPVYWTGPSIGFDVGGNADSAFVLVYNLKNADDIYRRYGAGEGQAYLVGGFHVSYLRRGDVVLIPVRLGVGLRLGVNGGYMKFSRKQNWVPF